MRNSLLNQTNLFNLWGGSPQRWQVWSHYPTGPSHERVLHPQFWVAFLEGEICGDFREKTNLPAEVSGVGKFFLKRGQNEGLLRCWVTLVAQNGWFAAGRGIYPAIKSDTFFGVSIPILGGGFKHLLIFTPKNWGVSNDPIWRHIYIYIYPMDPSSFSECT